MTLENEHPGKRALNPFAFVPETNAFFTLLAITAPVWMIELGLVLGMSIGQDRFFTIILLLFVFFLSTVIYITHPFRIRYRKGLQQFTMKNDAEFVDAFQKLVTRSKVASSPGIEMDSDPRSVSGQAFGLLNHYTVRLGRRIRLLFRKDPSGFEAIVLHELAHIANSDIERTYLTQAIRTAVIITSVIPFVLLVLRFLIGILAGGAGVSEVPIVLLSLLKMFGALLVVTAIYRSLLREREFYADWRATLWGAGDALLKILRRNQVNDQHQSWKRFWRFHPTSSERIAVLQEPMELFRVKPGLPFLVGVLSGLILGGLASQSELLLGIMQIISNGLESFLGSDFFTGIWVYLVLALMAFVLFAIPGFILIHLVTNSLGLAVQRESIARMSMGQAGWPMYVSLWKPALLLAIGYQAGALLSIASILEIFPTLVQSIEGWLYIFMLFALLVLFALLTWMGLVYMSVFSRQIIGAHVGRSIPTLKMKMLSIVLSGIMTLLYVPVVFGQSAVEGAASESDISVLLPWALGIALAIVVALVFFGMTVAGTWLFVRMQQSISKPRCPSCGKIIRQQTAVGRTCEHCGHELAEWLYIPEFPQKAV